MLSIFANCCIVGRVQKRPTLLKTFEEVHLTERFLRSCGNESDCDVDKICLLRVQPTTTLKNVVYNTFLRLSCTFLSTRFWLC